MLADCCIASTLRSMCCICIVDRLQGRRETTSEMYPDIHAQGVEFTFPMPIEYTMRFERNLRPINCP